MPSTTSPDSPAYREAGHVLMAYLIVKKGIADHFFALPIEASDRAWLVPSFETVSLDQELSTLDRPSPSLRSLITTPIFLLAGVAAERFHNSIPTDVPLPSIRPVTRAGGMLSSYFEEYGEDDPRSMQRKVSEMLRVFFDFSDEQVRTHWAAVQTLAQRLMEQGSLSTADAFARCMDGNGSQLCYPLAVNFFSAPNTVRLHAMNRDCP